MTFTGGVRVGNRLRVYPPAPRKQERTAFAGPCPPYKNGPRAHRGATLPSVRGNATPHTRLPQGRLPAATAAAAPAPIARGVGRAARTATTVDGGVIVRRVGRGIAATRTAAIAATGAAAIAAGRAATAAIIAAATTAATATPAAASAAIAAAVARATAAPARISGLGPKAQQRQRDQQHP